MGLFTPNVRKLAKEKDVEALLKCVRHNNAEIRMQSFVALKDLLTQKEILEKLRFLERDQDPRIRSAAILEFAHIGDKKTFENIRSIIITGARNDKVDALRILANRDETEVEGVSSIVALALHDKNMMVKSEAIKTMGAFHSRLFVWPLEECLHDRRMQIRYHAVKSLGNLGIEEAVDTLIGALLDDNLQIRRSSSDALRKIGTPKAVKALEDAPFQLMVKLMNESSAKRQEIVIEIGKYKRKEGIPLLIRACNDEYKTIRLESVKSLGKLRDRSSIPVIYRMLDDKYYDVRMEACRTLEKINDTEALIALEKAMRDKNTNVREIARHCYYSLKARLENLERTKNPFYKA